MKLSRLGTWLVGCALVLAAVPASAHDIALNGPGGLLPRTAAPAVGKGIDPASIALSPDGTTAYVCAEGQDQVLVVDLATQKVSATIPVGVQPLGIALSSDGAALYVTNYGASTVSVIDTATQQVTKTITVGGAPTAVALTPDGSHAYVVDFYDGMMSVIDTASLTVSGTIAIGSLSESVAVTPDGGQALVANFETLATASDGMTVSAIALGTGQITQQIGVGDLPDTVAITPDGQTALVVNEASGSVSLVDLATASVTATVPVGLVPHGIAITPDGHHAYVVNESSNAVSVINLGTAAVTATVAIGQEPWAIAAAPDGLHVYAVNQGDGTLSVIATATNNVVATIPLAPAPLAAAVLPGSRSVQLSATATVFATLLNSGTSAVSDCAIALGDPVPAGLTFSYQTTAAATNAPIGTPNTPVDIPAAGAQSFVLAFQSTSVLSDIGQKLAFTCDSVLPASVVPGVDTIDLVFTAAPTQDIIALAATAPQPGIVAVPVGGDGAFAVATDNAGVAGTLTVSADTGDATLPLTVTLCPTLPSTGTCLATPAATVEQGFGAGATPTFSVFLSASAAIPFAPATSRVFVRFTDAAGVTHGSTSVAVEAP